MHEHHQVAHLITEILKEAQIRNLPKVSEIEIALGDALGFDEGSIKLYFETLGIDTILEGATITFHHIPAELLCQTCQKNFIKKGSMITCPICGQQGIPTAIGKDFYAKFIA